jgi:hypothetical protein
VDRERILGPLALARTEQRRDLGLHGRVRARDEQPDAVHGAHRVSSTVARSTLAHVTDAAVPAEQSSGDTRLAVLLAMAMFVLVVDTSLMNVP